MDWIKLSERKPDNKQKCLVKTWVQLDLFYDMDKCMSDSIYSAIYDNDSFYELKTKKKIENIKYWKPL